MTFGICLLVFLQLLKGYSSQSVGAPLSSSCGQPANPDFISEDQNTNLGEYPWIALIGYYDADLDQLMYACTGALVNPRYVITSATCLLTKHVRQVSSLTHVRLGEHNIKAKAECYEDVLGNCLREGRSVDVEIEEAVPHSGYSPEGLRAHNIALVRLNETIDLITYSGFINAICLPEEDIVSTSMRDLFQTSVVGWDFGSGRPNDVLMREYLSFATDAQCDSVYRGFDGTKQICMKSNDIRRRCIGDSGSPLSFIGLYGSHTLIGILSFGPLPCGFSDTPSVFTSVAYYKDWININMRSYV